MNAVAEQTCRYCGFGDCDDRGIVAQHSEGPYHANCLVNKDKLRVIVESEPEKRKATNERTPLAQMKDDFMEGYWEGVLRFETDGERFPIKRPTHVGTMAWGRHIGWLDKEQDRVKVTPIDGGRSCITPEERAWEDHVRWRRAGSPVPDPKLAENTNAPYYRSPIQEVA